MMILPVSRTRLPLRRVEGQTLLTHRESSPGDGLTRGTVRQGLPHRLGFLNPD
jgi:hypothetical protein